MAFDADNVIVAPFGHVFVAPVGTPFPTDVDNVPDSMDSDWVDLGYLSENGISGTFGLDTTDIRSWQADTPIRRQVNARTATISFELMEWKEDGVTTAFGGGTWTPGAGNKFTYEFPTAAEGIAEVALAFDVTDGDTHYAFGFSRATVSGDITIGFTRGNAAVMAVAMGLLADESTGAIGTLIGVQTVTS